MANTTTRFGAVPNAGLTYVLCGAAVPAATTWNLILSAVNRSVAATAARAFIASATWNPGDGEPTGGKLVAAIWYDTPLTVGQVFQESFIVLNAGEQIVVRASVASSIDFIACGIAIT